MSKGKLIVIEGADGSGKKTQADLLIKNLKQSGLKTAYYDFPQYEKSFFGKMVGRYLNGEFGDVDEVSPYLISTFYAGDRFEASKKIKKDLEAGKIIVTNRYIQSNMAHQTAKLRKNLEKKKFVNWLKKMEFEVLGIPKADLVIYLYVPYKIGKELVAKKTGRKYTAAVHDIHEKNEEYMERTAREYMALAKTEPEWRMVDCRDKKGGVSSIPEIGEKVSKIIKQELAGK